MRRRPYDQIVRFAESIADARLSVEFAGSTGVAPEDLHMDVNPRLCRLENKGLQRHMNRCRVVVLLSNGAHSELVGLDNEAPVELHATGRFVGDRAS